MSTVGRFTKIEKLGEGTYGTVYRARDINSNEVVALKRMNPVTSEDEGVPATTIREIMLLKELQHPNIVLLKDVLFQPPKLTLVFENCECDLKRFMEKFNKKLELDKHVKVLMYQLVAGIAYMHRKSVVHRDLKPQNLLVNDDLSLKIADFGLARVEGIPVKKYSHEAVTLWYRSPDVILGSANYGFAVDMWSIGCIFAEMVTGVPLFSGKTDHEQLLRMFKLLGSGDYPNSTNPFPSKSLYPNAATVCAQPGLTTQHQNAVDTYVQNSRLKELDPHGLDLLWKMLQFEPSRRVTAAQALAHPYFQNVVVPSSVASAANLEVNFRMDKSKSIDNQESDDVN